MVKMLHASKPISQPPLPHPPLSPSQSRYILPSDDSEIQRLNLQSLFLTQQVSEDKLIYAPAYLEHGDHVLESGTGTGIWLTSLASQVPPSISFTGIDIQTRLFPQPSSYPSNISFLQHSITSLPFDWSNRFSFVNQRLLIGGLSAQEWAAALREIHRVLIPGGWFQCIEPHFPSKPESDSVGPCTGRIFDLLRALMDRNGLVWSIALELGGRDDDDGMLSIAGFVNVQSCTVSLPVLPHEHSGTQAPSRTTEFTHRTLMEWFFAALRPGMVATKLLGSAEEFDELLKSVFEEWDQNPDVAWSWAIVYAQKQGMK
ncbi:hypothetical protein D9757_006656 [Collybiopsis confluens]|uniref:Methyltransferase domain-containing protein n=1 Tax=Collybiopsis confluens TaxID=2823264 RepID=A0A8H5HNJ2_9AGAR|nr:hypothetical protein D9757_006656 [Collybiopsis confluens]